MVALLAVAPVGVRPAFAIAHGENAPADHYRFSVRLTMIGLPTAGHGARDSSCSGALVAPRWVVTAGHCFRDAAGRRVSRPVARRTTAMIGRTDLSRRDGHEVEVVGVRQADTADVALVELAAAVTDIPLLRIGTAPPAAGEVVRLTGYGLTTDDESAQASRLQTGQFVVDRVGDSVLETSGRAPKPDTSPCPHDSGGPYFQERPNGPVLVAVVSSGPGCPHAGPDFSARTDNLADWLTTTIDDDGGVFPQWAWPVAGAGLLALTGVLTVMLAARRRSRGAGRRRAADARGAQRPSGPLG